MNTKGLPAPDPIPSKKLPRWGAEANSSDRDGICQSFPLPLVLGGKAMKSGTLLSPDRPLPVSEFPASFSFRGKSHEICHIIIARLIAARISPVSYPRTFSGESDQ